MSRLEKFLKQCSARRALNQRGRRRRFVSGFESLEPRLLLSVSAVFTPQDGGVLTIMGDALDNNIAISRNAAGNLLVNGGTVAILGGTPTVANTARIVGFGLGGNDTMALVETNGALPGANLFGGAGNDTLTGGSGADQLFGQSGNDTMLGKGGVDALYGGSDNDVLTGGDGDDRVFGKSGNDRIIWNLGDDTDLNEGGSHIDTVEVNGGNGAENFTVTANGTRVRFDRLDLVPFSLDIGTSENLIINANGGDDTISTAGNLATLTQITMDGGAGNDTLLGSNGADLILGGDGNDFIDGQQGSDVALMGAGDDTFQWDPGDGNDVVEGQAGLDALRFNGSGIGENVDISANGARLRVFRNVGVVTMDLDDVEQVDCNAQGGADTIVVNDLSGTDATKINLNLAAFGSGDAQPDTVIVNGTNGDDGILVSGDANGVAVTGLSTQVNITGAESANDRLTINAQAGDDLVDASGLAVTAIQLTADGGEGDDILFGNAGNNVLLGGNGDDLLVGAGGLDTLDGGTGVNIVI